MRRLLDDALRELAASFECLESRNVDQGMELLTGILAGRRGADGRYPEGTQQARIEERLER
jgi:hypothetical protein